MVGETGAPALEPVGKASRHFLDVWREKVSRHGGVPDRRDIRPEDLLPIIDHVWLYERVGDDFRCLIMGNHVERRWKRPVIGYYFKDLFGPTHAVALINRLMIALERRYLGFGVADVAREGWYAERTYVPLLDKTGQAGFILGVSSYIDRTVTIRMEDRNIPLGLTYYYDAVTLEYARAFKD